MMPRTTIELFNSRTRIGSRGKSEDWWTTIPLNIGDPMVKERNARCFKGQNDSFDFSEYMDSCGVVDIG